MSFSHQSSETAPKNLEMLNQFGTIRCYKTFVIKNCEKFDA